MLMWQKIKNYYHLLQAFLAALFFNFPSNKIKVIGVTGTDGKTTTVHMIYEILKSSGYKVSMISSQGAVIGSNIHDTGFHVTTPSSYQVQKYLTKAQNEGHQYFVLETTSHGLDQNRLAFVNFEIGVLTNITHDHLDYHKTWENYALSKSRLFQKVKFSVLNLDDKKSFLFLQPRVRGKIVTYGLNVKADINPQNYPIRLKIPGRHNEQNALAACAVGDILKVKKSNTIKALNSFSSVRGRMEEIDMGQDFKVIIDFAHTPNALKNALETLRSQVSGGRIIVLFGAAGERDRIKRPLMGQVAAKSADIIILTAEDPRSEDVREISHQIARGIKGKTQRKNLFLIDNRSDAIDFAIKMAKKNDIIALFGKGHEKSMCLGKEETPWDEFETAKSIIRRRQNAKTS